MNQPPPPDKTESKLPPKEKREAGGGKAPKGNKRSGKIPVGYVPRPFRPLGLGLARTPVVSQPGLSRFQQSVTVDINPDPTEKSDTPPDPDPSEVFGRKGLNRTPPPISAPRSSPDPVTTETPSGAAGSEPTVSDKTFRIAELNLESSSESEDSIEPENPDEIETLESEEITEQPDLEIINPTPTVNRPNTRSQKGPLVGPEQLEKREREARLERSRRILFEEKQIERWQRKKRLRQSQSQSKSQSEPTTPRKSRFSQYARDQDFILGAARLEPNLVSRYADLSVGELEQKMKMGRLNALTDSRDDLNEETRSEASKEGDGTFPTGLHNMFKHVVKPIGQLMDPELRDNVEVRARSVKHLDKITPSAVTRALREEEVLIRQDRKMKDLIEVVVDMAKDMVKLKAESTTKARAAIEKSGQLYPSEGHPSEYNRCADDVWVKAVSALQAGVKVIERSVLFRDRPYDYLLEVCGYSNSIATSYGLSKLQHKSLILSAIPATSVLSKELKLLTSLDHIFALASLNASTIHTKAELDAKLEAWRLNFTSLPALIESIGNLKTLIADAEEFQYGSGDQQRLYGLMIRRVKREKLPAQVDQNLEEARMRIENETDPIVLHEIFLAAIKCIVSIKGKPQMQTVHQTHLAENPQGGNLGHPQMQQTGGQQSTGAVPKQKQKQNNNNNGKNKQDKQNNSGQYQGQNNKKGNGNGNGNGGGNGNQKSGNQRDRSKSRTRNSMVGRWPENVPYHSKNGNKLSRDCEQHFSGHCFRCGHSSHKGGDCRIYPERTAVLTLCITCRQGFHDSCKSYRYAKKEGSKDDARLMKIENILEGLSNKEPVTIQYPEVRYVNPYPAYPPFYPPPHPYPPAQLQHAEEEEDEDE
jgi:hypothetical protein